MKKFILGALAALGSLGLYKMHKDGKFPVLKIKGTVNDVDFDNRTFQVRSSLEKNVLMDIAVSPATGFMWLAQEGKDTHNAKMEDLSIGQRVSVSFAKNKESGRIVAERVVIENV